MALWLDLLNAGQQANQAMASPEALPAAPQSTSGGVGPWASQQGRVPRSYLQQYLDTGEMFHVEQPGGSGKTAPAPPSPSPPPKTTPLAKGVGAKGETGQLVDEGLSTLLQGASTGASLLEGGAQAASSAVPATAVLAAIVDAAQTYGNVTGAGKKAKAAGKSKSKAEQEAMTDKLRDNYAKKTGVYGMALDKLL